MASPSSCPFCVIRPGAMVLESAHSLALRDGYPVAPGHILVIPRRHVASVFDLRPEEWDDLWALVRRIPGEVPELGAADALNVGINDGPAAGQTVAHAHVHLIPRTLGDVPDPRGGVRWVLPASADYWTQQRTRAST
jgi:diadenosine tetraphosphate (Ap4A) HIT family hydrolase